MTGKKVIIVNGLWDLDKRFNKNHKIIIVRVVDPEAGLQVCGNPPSKVARLQASAPIPFYQDFFFWGRGVVKVCKMSDWRDFQCFCGPISFSGKNPNPPLNKKQQHLIQFFFSIRGHHTTSNLNQPIESFLFTRHFRLNLLFFQNLSISDRVTFRTQDQLERHNYDNDVKKRYVITANDVTLPPSSCPYVFLRRTVHR